MKFSLDKLLAAFGNIRAMERTHIDDHTEAIINDIDDKPLAISDRNVLYAAFGELGGYHFIQTIILGSFHIKTLKGAQLKIVLDDEELNLNSDMKELESDYSNVSGRSITRIDFQIEKDDILKIEGTRPTKLVLTSDKKMDKFKIYEEPSESVSN